MSKKRSLQTLIEQTSELLRSQAKKEHKYSTKLPSNAYSFVAQIDKIAKMLRKNVSRRGKKKKK